MQIHFTLNHKKTAAEIAPDTLLIDLVRSLGCKSVKRGCETANCGLCTVFLDEKPVLSCSVLAARVDGRSVTTLEGLPLAWLAALIEKGALGQKTKCGIYKKEGKQTLVLDPAKGEYVNAGEKGDDAVKAIKAADVHAVIMIAVNKPAAAFMQRYREQGGGAQLYNISVVDPTELVKLAGLKNAHGLGISQVVPYPSTGCFVRSLHLSTDSQG